MSTHMQQLPEFQDITLSAYGTYQAASQKQRVRYPDGFPRTTNTRVLRAPFRKVLCYPELAKHIRAHEEANSIGTLTKNQGQLEILYKQEEKELCTAFLGRPRKDDMLAERGVAITILSHNNFDGDFDLLDAAAYIAHSPDERGRRASRDARIFYLAGTAAQNYVVSHLTDKDADPATKSSMGKRAQGVREVCVSWVDEADDDGRFKRQSSYAEIEYQSSSSKEADDFGRLKSPTAADNYVGAIKKAINKAAHYGGCKVPLGRCMGNYMANSHGSVDEYYERACIDTANEFFKIIHGSEICKLCPYTESEDFNGELEQSETWARLVPKHLDPLSTLCTSAVLLHQKGFGEQMVRFCKDVQTEEKNRNPNNKYYGLRAPKLDEVPIAPHLMYLSAHKISLKDSVTAYSIAQNVPGVSLYRGDPRSHEARWGTAVLAWERCLVPLDDNVLRHILVFPCSEHACSMRRDLARVSVHFFEAMENLRKECFGSVFNSGFNMESITRTSEAEQASGSESEEASGSRKRKLTCTDEERALLKALRFDLLNPSLSLGDAHSEMTSKGGPVEFSNLLLALSAFTSPDTGILQGFAAGHEILRSFERNQKAAHEKIMSLQSSLDRASSERSTSTSSLDTLATMSADSVHNTVDEKLSSNGLEMLRKCLKLCYTSPLNLPQVMDLECAGTLCKKICTMLGIKMKDVIDKPSRTSLYKRIVDMTEFPFVRSVAIASTEVLQHTGQYDSIVTVVVSQDGITAYTTKQDGQAHVVSPIALLNQDTSRMAFVVYNEPKRIVYTLRTA